ncbi:MAG: hypothetical protein AAGI17_02990 [Planctomycetota bacterium]
MSDAPTPESIIPRNVAPSGFAEHVFERSRPLGVDRAGLWRWLNTPETFTRQVWPYRVEFVEGTGVHGGGGFEVGTLNTHHGPFLNCSGVITRTDETEGVRDLHYFYGAFIVSPRLIRPRRLLFTLTGEPDNAHLKLRVECDVKPWVAGVWTGLQSMFWSSFFGSARRGAIKAARSA